MITMPSVMSLMIGWALFQSPPNFEAQVIDSKVAIGYGLAIGDVDGDGKPDILLADKKQFVWYRNGDWKRFVMVENLTEFDNVCIAARDINGDGKVEVAVGAQWNPSETSDTLRSGSVHYLIRPADPEQLWTPVELHHEPTIHRMRWVKTGADKFQLVVVPLHGRGNKNGEGESVRIIGYEMPKDPRQRWRYHAVDQSMHLTHNLDVRPEGPSAEKIFIGGKEGIKVYTFRSGKWIADSEYQPIRDRSFGEVRLGTGIIAGISPMHGNELALHTSTAKTTLTADLNQGHALAVSNLMGSQAEEIVAGWREPNKDNKIGIKLFASETGTANWKEFWIDENGMACEDLQVADLNGDGKPEIIASGRSTHNLKIYWNKN